MRRLRRAHQRQAQKRNKLRQRAIAAGTAAVITLGAGAGLSKSAGVSTPDGHQMPVSQDADGDLLGAAEEIAIGYLPFNSDQNRNTVSDGVELAQHCAAVIDKLYLYNPDTKMPIPYGPYKIRRALFGSELCDICGQKVNMGGIEIFNPRVELQYPDPNDPLDAVLLPDLALHYMEHGSFDCFGDVHQGRVDVPRLLRILETRYPYDPNDHRLPVDGADLDGDLLRDTEELASGYNLYDADQDDDLTADGIELAGQCARAIDSLPVFDPNGPEIDALHKVSFMQRGIEHCDICGATVNMGYWQVTNLRLGLSTDVPVLALHYMGHGSLSYAGDVHGTGRVDIPLLVKILEMPRRCGDLGTIYLPSDTNKDCRVDSADLLELVERWLEDAEINRDR
ncbi:MAG: hypothetical protein JSW66_02480 [Phycisphaerales bacterium]|nr:MAG: hypothetical protein JSW66_02480 [Phycisphaerales bacterium]